MQLPESIYAALPIAAWNAWLSRRSVKHGENIASIDAKLAAMHALLVEVREDQKRREGNGHVDF